MARITGMVTIEPKLLKTASIVAVTVTVTKPKSAAQPTWIWTTSGPRLYTDSNISSTTHSIFFTRAKAVTASNPTGGPPKVRQPHIMVQKDFSTHLQITGTTILPFPKTGAIRGKKAPAYYMIGLLALDRPLLRRLREQRVLKRELAILLVPLKQMAEACIAGKDCVDVAQMSRLILEMTARLPAIASMKMVRGCRVTPVGPALKRKLRICITSCPG